MLLVALKSALDLLLLVLLNPLFLLLAIGTGALFLLAKTGHAWAVAAWTFWLGTLTAAFADIKADPVALVVLSFVCSVNLTIGLIAVAAYFVVRKFLK